jgi:hypothetical protein
VEVSVADDLDTVGVGEVVVEQMGVVLHVVLPDARQGLD